MKLPIPDDWDGTAWGCVEIRWPDSPYWWALLLGFITTPLRGRFWDENTGSILAMQAIGQQIYSDNQPWVTCCGGDGDINNGDGTAEEIIRYIYAGSGVEGDEEFMGWLCGVNPAAFKIEDGVLSVKNFCGDWVEIGALTSPGEIAVTDVWPEEDPPATYYPCGKAAMLIKYLVALSTTAWEGYADIETFEAAMRAAVPMATLSRARIYQIASSLVLLDNAGMNEAHFTNEDAIQTAKCWAVEDMGATSEGTGDERGAVVEAMASAFYNIVGLMTKDQWFAYWHQMAETIGDEDCRLILSMGATDDTQDCDCPYDDVVEASQIYFNGVYDEGTQTGTALESFEVLNGGRRIKIQMGAAAGSWRECGNMVFGLAGAVAGDDITVRMYPAPGYVDILTKEWQVYAWGTPAPVADWNEPVFEVIQEGEIVAGDGYLEKSTDNTGAQLLDSMKWGGRFYPSQNGVEPWRTQIIFEVVAVNGVALTPIGP